MRNINWMKWTVKHKTARALRLNHSQYLIVIKQMRILPSQIQANR